MIKISEKYNLIKEDLIKIWRGFLIAFGGALVTYLANVTGMIDYSNFGEYAMVVQSLVMVGSSTLINAINKILTVNAYLEIEE